MPRLAGSARHVLGTAVLSVLAFSLAWPGMALAAGSLTLRPVGDGFGIIRTSDGHSCSTGQSCVITSSAYVPGFRVTLTATPDGSTSRFAGWSGGGCDSIGANVCTVTMTGENVTVQAGFARLNVSLTVLINGGEGGGAGTVTSDPAGISCGQTCSADFPSGGRVTLTAVPACGSSFTSWSGGGCSGTGACILYPTAATTVTASFRAPLGSSPLVAAVLPNSRSVKIGTAATAFATVINQGPGTATACSLAPGASLPATFVYQTTDPATNQTIGMANQPVDIPAGLAQSFVFALTATAPILPTELPLAFACTNTAPALSVTGLNTILLSASSYPVPDIVALAATLDGDGIVKIPGATGTGVFSVATVNVGVGGLIQVEADTQGVNLPVRITLCETNPITGVCLAAPQSLVTTQIDANTTPTFGVFVRGLGAVPFCPATDRVVVRFKGYFDKEMRGATSVAVRTQ
jgi:hypothetical protein